MASAEPLTEYQFYIGKRFVNGNLVPMWMRCNGAGLPFGEPIVYDTAVPGARVGDIYRFTLNEDKTAAVLFADGEDVDKLPRWWNSAPGYASQWAREEVSAIISADLANNVFPGLVVAHKHYRDAADDTARAFLLGKFIEIIVKGQF